MRSSAGQIKDFSEGIIWNDMLEEIDIWLQRIRDELENPMLEFTHRTLDQLSGSAKAIRNMKDLPEVLMGLAEDEEYERENLNDMIGGRNERQG